MSNVIKFPTREAAKAAATATQLVFTMYSTEMEEVAIHVVDSSPIGVLSVVRHKDGVLAPMRSDKFPKLLGYMRMERPDCVPYRDVTPEEFLEEARKPEAPPKPVKIFPDGIRAAADPAYAKPEPEPEVKPASDDAVAAHEPTIRRFLTILSQQATRAIEAAGGADAPGYRRLYSIHPVTGVPVPRVLKIDDIDEMVKCSLGQVLVLRSCYDYWVFSRNSRNNSIPAEPFLGKPRSEGARPPPLGRVLRHPVAIFGHGARHGFNSRPTGNFFRHRPRARRGPLVALRPSGRTFRVPAMGNRLSAGRYRAPWGQHPIGTIQAGIP